MIISLAYRDIEPRPTRRLLVKSAVAELRRRRADGAPIRPRRS